MILGTKARYAVMAMVELTLRGGVKPVALSEVAEAQEIPLAYLEQIFNKLKRKQLVHAVRGPGGGYLLARPPGELRISEIVAAVDESLKMTRCEKESGVGCLGGKGRCLTHDLWEGLGAQIYAYLDSVTLADVCQGSEVRNQKFRLQTSDFRFQTSDF